MTAVEAALPGHASKLREFAYRFEVVDLDACFVDERYQRPLTSLAREIAAEYNPALVGTIITSEREPVEKTAGGRWPKAKPGSLAIIDGQNRWVGLQGAGEDAIPSLVYMGLSRAEESLIFALLQVKRRNLSTYQRFRAAMRAAEEGSENPIAEEAGKIAALVNGSGFVLSPDDEKNSIRAISALEAVYRRDPDLLAEVMQVISGAWGTDNKEAAAGDIIRGLAFFIEEQDPDLERLARKLAPTTPHILKANAAMLGAGRGGSSGSRARHMAEAITNEYLKRGR